MIAKVKERVGIFILGIIESLLQKELSEKKIPNVLSLLYEVVSILPC